VKRLGNVVVPDELGEMHRLLIVHMRDAGGLGMTRKEIRAIGIDDPRQAILDLRRAGYTIESNRSKIQPTDIFRWVLRREPRMPAPEQVGPVEQCQEHEHEHEAAPAPLTLPLLDEEASC